MKFTTSLVKDLNETDNFLSDESVAAARFFGAFVNLSFCVFH